MGHIVNGTALLLLLVSRAEILHIGSIHFGAGFGCADPIELGYKEIELKNDLPYLLVLPDIDVDLLGRLDDFLDIGGIVSNELLDVFLDRERALHGGVLFDIP